jgi:hypothetical protein
VLLLPSPAPPGRRSGQPRSVPHESPAGEFIGLPPGLDALGSQDQEPVGVAGGAWVPVGLLDVPLGQILRGGHKYGLLEPGVDDDDVAGGAEREPSCPAASMLRAVRDEFSTAITTRSSIHASDSGTRYGSADEPELEAVATQTGCQMYYEIHGSGGTHPCSFFTVGCSIDLQFGELIPKLAATRQVVAADFQGHGRTNDIDRRPGARRDRPRPIPLHRCRRGSGSERRLGRPHLFRPLRPAAASPPP